MKYVIAAACLALSACGSSLSTPSTGTSPVAVVAPSGSVMSFLNAARAQNGLPPVSEDRRLSQSAQRHAQDMQANGFFAHTGSNGSSFSDRARAAGYTCARNENIANGQRTAEGVVTAWMNSPGHRRNLLASNVTEFGIGRTDNNWVLVMGAGC
ncbi:CAP domain-containing protein [Pseudooctadecabacter sp.]|uniref:CAP domain-containing protein n=1 Tax=Pseudooctadecabacter sp. TaxID=1966338 RepID=UPI0035C7C2C4